jgi:arylsulfatase A-like enzyme
VSSVYLEAGFRTDPVFARSTRDPPEVKGYTGVTQPAPAAAAIGRRLPGLACGLLILACLSSWAPASAQPSPAPNIIVILADDLGRDVDPCRDKDSPMRFLRQICGRAAVLENFYTHPYSAPSRATLLTGRHPFRHGVNDNHQDATKLSLAEETLPEFIRANAAEPYLFAGFGTWHLADPVNGRLRNPNLQGFDHFAGLPVHTGNYDYFDYDWYENGQLAEQPATYLTSRIADAAIAFVAGEKSDLPLFLWVSFTSPAAPYHVPPSNLHSAEGLKPIDLQPTLDAVPRPDQYRVNQRQAVFDPLYNAMLEALDHETERLVLEISAQSLRPSVFVFLSDNGSAAEVYRRPTAGKQRARATLYDGGVRVPLMVWTDKAPQAAIVPGLYEHPVHGADLFATLAEMAGVPVRRLYQSADGRDSTSLFDMLQTGPARSLPPRNFAFVQRGNEQRMPYAYGAVDRDGMKLILREPARPTAYSPGVLAELYDTSADPDEMHNLFPGACGSALASMRELFGYIERTTAVSPFEKWFQPVTYLRLLEDRKIACSLPQ